MLKSKISFKEIIVESKAIYILQLQLQMRKSKILQNSSHVLNSLIFF